MPETAQHNFRLSPTTIEKLDELKEHMGMSARAAVVNHAITVLYRMTFGQAKKTQKKSQASN
jgi:hypothetical protein